VNCQDAFKILSADVDGELSSGEAELLAYHLRSCNKCSRSRALLASTRQAFQEAVCEARWCSTSSPNRLFRSSLLSRYWIAIAATLALALAFLFFWEQGPLPVPQSPMTFVSSTAEKAQGLNEGRIDTAIDCGREGSNGCVIERPCLNGECTPFATTGIF
jgi:hypothetical protein